jgi:hypothetical protein
MNFPAIIRLGLYAAGFAASAYGFATFDPETGIIDILPFSLESVLTGAATLTAMVALTRGWGK